MKTRSLSHSKQIIIIHTLKCTFLAFVNVLISFLMLISLESANASVPTSARAEQAMARVSSTLKATLEQQHLRLGAPIFIRIFKQEAELEVWMENAQGHFQHVKTYKVCTYSGDLGPKQRVGDQQAPEGFYYVNGARMNPWSQFHLSFNIGYPNRYDRYYHRTGSALMVHGSCASIGCFAMTDAKIEEIYTLAHAALANGQPYFRVHIFPFNFKRQQFAGYAKRYPQWASFWQNLYEGFNHFEMYKRPPNVGVQAGRYVFDRT